MARFALLLILGAALGLATAASAGDGTPIRATRLLEERPVSGSGYLAWAQNSRRHPRLYKVYARYGAGKPFLVNRRFQGFPGSISGKILAYQEFAPARGVSSIRFYDLQRRRHVAVARGVNSSLWEWRPSLSGDWLLFSRNDGRSESVILLNIRTRSQVELDRGRMRSDGNYGIAGQVNGNFAVWHRCPRGDRPCVVFRFDLTTRVKTPLAPPLGFIHYAPSVAADGTTYLVRSEYACGVSVELWRYPLAGGPVSLLGLPAGRDISNTYVETRIGPRGTINDVYHDRGSCDVNRFDLWTYSDIVLPNP